MKVNRREFIASSAVGTAISGLSPSLSASQGTRRLSITFHGLAIFAIGRPNSQAGMPARTSRVDVMFVTHPEHLNPKLYGGPSTLDVGGGDLQILVDGVVLGSSTSVPNVVELKVAPADVCPINGLEWENLRRIPEFERILQTQVTVRPTSLGSTPAGLSGRFTMRTGVLGGEVPRQPYDGEAWKFPGGDINYIRAFTDTATWSVPLEDTQQVTCRVVKFGASTPGPSVNLGPGDVSLFLRAGRDPAAGAPVPSPTIDHFGHYYPLLQYSGTLTPLPTRVAELCREVPLTTEQIRRQQRLTRFVTNAQNDDCGGDTGLAAMRGEPGICENGIAYADFK